MIVLEEPFFSENYPFFMNYAGIGFIASHELGHAFEHHVLFENPIYDSMIECLNEQYGDFKYQGKNVSLFYTNQKIKKLKLLKILFRLAMN